MNYERLVRGTATPKDLAEKLDLLGVEPGTAFAVVKLDSIEDLTRDRTGGARNSDPESSKESARATLTAPAVRAAFDVFVNAHPHTLAAFELEGAWRRVSDLKGLELIEPCGKRWNPETKHNVDTYMLTVKGLMTAGLDSMRTKLEALPPEEVTAEPVVEEPNLFAPSTDKPHNALTYDGD